MKIDINIYNILIIIVATYLISTLLMFLCAKIAKHVGAIDYPNEERRIHKKPTPRLGGIGIFVAFMLGYMIFGTPSTEMNAILICGFLLVITGIIDDIKPVPNRYKLIIQLICAFITVFYGKFLLTEISALGLNIIFKWWSYPITIFFIVGAINCINFIDGMDGLSGGICSIYFATVGIIATVMVQHGGLDVLLSFVLLGATLGYLQHNFHPARIFMGDGGSMFLGYMVAVIALIGYKNVTFSSIIVPLILLAIPIIDTLLAILRRIIKKESAMTPDKDHIHFQLYKYSKSIKKTVLFIYAIDILFASVSILYVLGDNKLALYIYIFLLILVLILILKTNVLIDWNSKKKKKD